MIIPNTRRALALLSLSLTQTVLFTTPGHCADVTSSKFESKFYKDFPPFSTFPIETAARTPIEHFGPVGIGINLLLPPFQMQVSRVDKGSPAEATGKIKVGQMIESINGEVLKDIDPRIQLGAIITKAEATDGVIKFMLKETADAKTAEEVIVKIPVLGSYSKTWPLNCPKSDKIVRDQAEFLKRTGANGMGLGQLFLLSTGEEKDLEVVRGWVQAEVAKQKDAKQIDSIPWHSGYSGIGLCEYYLRTGDAAVIPLIEKHADYLKRNMYNGGWNQRGGVNYSYGHLNAASIPAAAFLLLAKECGAQVDEYTLQESFKQFYRLAGHGNVAYGNNMPDSGFVDNGKVGKMAFFMAAAASLTPEGEKSVYAKARDISAVRSFYSTSWMFHGHTGGGIGEIWRGASMGLMADKKPLKFREFMDNRQWFYELSRHYDGSMGIVGNYHGGGGYDDPNSWGIGITLAYTIPRKTLRITGAPASKFAKPYQLPKRPWGTEADEAFFSMTPAPDKNGKVQDWDSERLATDASWPILRKVNDPNATDETLLMYARHPDQGVREMAAQMIGQRAKGPLILELLKDKDPRARQAGLMAVSSPALLTDEVAAILIGMINDPEESWWVVIHALNRLGMANPELLVPHIDRLCHWAQHEEWWLQKAALTALTGLATDERFYQKLLPLIGEVATTNRVADIMGPVRAITAKLNGAKPEVQALGAKVLGQAYAEFPKKLSAPGGLDLSNRVIGNSPVDCLEKELAANLASLPGGLEVLYTLGKERFPEQSLPHRDLFLGAPPEQLGPKVTGALKPAILNNLVPEHVGKNWKTLSALAKAEMKAANHPGGRVDVMDQLADLYRRAGDTTDYSWHTFGPDRLQGEWAYFTFDPPEKKLWDSAGRFRPVTVPAEMTQWFAKDFDPAKAGWKKGRAPFVNVSGKLQAGICKSSPCACGDAPGTLWDKEVLLMRRSFDLPPMKPGHRYRLVVGGTSHVGTGEGWTVYVNGRQMAEVKGAFGRNSGGQPKGAFITSEWFDEFKNGGKMEVAAIAFLSARKDKQNNINIWFEEMKMPPFSDDQVRTWAANISLVSADWQSLQDPNRKTEDPEAGKFKWDGKFVANPALLGTWTTVAMVPSVDVFDPAKPVDANKAPFKEITFKEGGKTDDGLRMWTGDTLLDLGSGVYTPLQILKMTVKGDHLFLEAGGFSEKNPVSWKSPLVVMKRK
ncbi:MAG: DUF6288 domain-containing protein [Akkermansiaceae bacterium]